MQQNGNPLAANMAAQLETALSPEIASVLSPGPSYDPTSPLSSPIPAFNPAPLGVQPQPKAPSASQIMQNADRRSAELASGALRKFGSIAQKFPGAEKVRIRKHFQNGQTGPIGEWTFRDATQDGDIEAFCLKHVRPTYGGGEYSVEIYDGHGRGFDAGKVFLPMPLAGAPAPLSGGSNDVAMRLIDKIDALGQRVATPPVDPFTQYQQTQARLEEIRKATGGDSNAAMMMLMMQNQQRGPDPYVVETMSALRSEIATLKQAAATPNLPMIPPPPPENPMLNALAAALPALATALVTKLTSPPERDPNALTTKDVIDLVTRKQEPTRDPVTEFQNSMRFFREMQGGQKEESLTDKLKEMAALKELAVDIAGGGGSPQGTTFWDALGALFSNKSFGDNLGAMLGQEIKARQAAEKKALPQQAGGAPQQAPAAAPAAPQRRVMVPDNMRDYCAKMEGADSDGDRAQAVISALSALEPDPQWKPFVRALLEEVAKGNKDTSLRSLGGWLKFLCSNGLLDEKAAYRVLQTFDKNWETIHTLVRMQLGPMAPAMPTAPQTTLAQPAAAPPAPVPAPPPAPVAPPVVEAPPPPDSENDGDEEDEEGDESE